MPDEFEDVFGDFGTGIGVKFGGGAATAGGDGCAVVVGGGEGVCCPDEGGGEGEELHGADIMLLIFRDGS